MRYLGYLVFLSIVCPFLAGEGSPIGFWRTIDDQTGAAKSVVEIYVGDDGLLEGRVVEILQSDRGPDPICSECEGARKDQPIRGMVILWGMRAEGKGWGDGRILDPTTGTIYRCRLRLSASGALEVRGFLGISLFGRSQEWARIRDGD